MRHCLFACLWRSGIPDNSNGVCPLLGGKGGGRDNYCNCYLTYILYTLRNAYCSLAMSTQRINAVGRSPCSLAAASFNPATTAKLRRAQMPAAAEW